MSLVQPGLGTPISGVRIPQDFYWVLDRPAPLAGMRLPLSGFPWASLSAAGVSRVVALHPGRYDPSPLVLAFSQKLTDLVDGGSPKEPDREVELVRNAVSTTVTLLLEGQGVVVHCHGGRGRTGIVIGCTLRELGHDASLVVDFLDSLHKARGKSGWPESPWQEELVRDWRADA